MIACFDFSLLGFALTLLCCHVSLPTFTVLHFLSLLSTFSYCLNCQVLVRTRNKFVPQSISHTREEIMCTVLPWQCFAGSPMHSSVPRRWGLDSWDICVPWQWPMFLLQFERQVPGEARTAVKPRESQLVRAPNLLRTKGDAKHCCGSRVLPSH